MARTAADRTAVSTSSQEPSGINAASERSPGTSWPAFEHAVMLTSKHGAKNPIEALFM